MTGKVSRYRSAHRLVLSCKEISGLVNCVAFDATHSCQDNAAGVDIVNHRRLTLDSRQHVNSETPLAVSAAEIFPYVFGTHVRLIGSPIAVYRTSVLQPVL